MNGDDDPEKHLVYAMCNDCGDWTLINVAPENYGYSTKNAKCTFCGSRNFNPQSVISKRTFNLERAKAATARHKRKLRNK